MKEYLVLTVAYLICSVVFFAFKPWQYGVLFLVLAAGSLVASFFTRSRV